MASYYIIEDNRQAGPFTLDQLMSRAIGYDTSVWTEGMPNWVPAGEIPELQQMLGRGSSQQSSYNSGYSGNYGSGGYGSGGYGGSFVPMPDSHKSKAVWALVLTIISMFCCGNCMGVLCLVFAILSLVAANRVESDYQMGNFLAAMKSSSDANKWANWAIAILIIGGLLSIVGWALYYFLVIAASMAGSY